MHSLCGGRGSETLGGSGGGALPRNGASKVGHKALVVIQIHLPMEKDGMITLVILSILIRHIRVRCRKGGVEILWDDAMLCGALLCQMVQVRLLQRLIFIQGATNEVGAVWKLGGTLDVHWARLLAYAVGADAREWCIRCSGRPRAPALLHGGTNVLNMFPGSRTTRCPPFILGPCVLVVGVCKAMFVVGVEPFVRFIAGRAHRGFVIVILLLILVFRAIVVLVVLFVLDLASKLP